MEAWILDRLSAVTAEEQLLLNGRQTIERERYMVGDRDVIMGQKLLQEGQLLSMRPHTRFVHFPEHSHDFVEMIYMCRGTTTHLVNGVPICLRERELLLLGQNARQEILPAGAEDIAVNFFIRPAFFSGMLELLGSEETPLRQFLIRCLGKEGPSEYLHFQVAQVENVQNLLENLLRILLEGTDRHTVQRLTMGLLFAELMEHADKLSVSSEEQALVVQVLRYIEHHYVDGSLTQISRQLHYDPARLSRAVMRRTGRTYTELVQERRLSQAAWLLRNTEQRVSDIARCVGYENISYFHRIFAEHFGCSPRAYRICK